MIAPNDRNTPLVTVITAAYNAESTILECIDSVMAQTFQKWELIVVDDASTDRTQDRITDAASRDNRIRPILQSENLGSGAARNLALQLADGKYVAVLDADDISLPTRLERQVSILETRTDLAGVGSQLYEFGDWGGPVLSRWPTAEGKIKERQTKNKMPIPHPSCMIRTAIAKAVGGYDETCRRSQDYAMFLRMRNEHFACLSEPLVFYRTTRPVTLGYAIKSGRYADLAKSRQLGRHDSNRVRTTPRSLPLSLKTDLRSTLQWMKRRQAERK
ncbi:hypothetical protein CH254_22205 [Rhodococcus sp. 06-412-2C]|uniref:glycosyltransferase family 2 protein n=1 Tax=unclassified Rhodococcus (in: high G+C Gram-positive bacteria) TaxID=192944 RepID=UPI000B9AB757|nr:hypothetical protein CH254_22205 [Rhodococcus sp. 06-412-2C]OZC93836.1 hypothetical protein CH279_20285 [Rhodococcus sp. 06-412-2B]